MPLHELGGAVQADVGAEFERALVIRCEKSVVDHVRDSGSFRNFGNGGNIGQFQCWIGRRLGEYQAGVITDRVFHVAGVGGIDKAAL